MIDSTIAGEGAEGVLWSAKWAASRTLAGRTGANFVRRSMNLDSRKVSFLRICPTFDDTARSP